MFIFKSQTVKKLVDLRSFSAVGAVNALNCKGIHRPYPSKVIFNLWSPYWSWKRDPGFALFDVVSAQCVLHCILQRTDAEQLRRALITFLPRGSPPTWHTSALEHTAASEGESAAPDHSISAVSVQRDVFNVAPLDMWWMATRESCLSAIISAVLMINAIFKVALMCFPSPQQLEGAFFDSVFNLHIRKQSGQDPGLVFLCSCPAELPLSKTLSQYHPLH